MANTLFERADQEALAMQKAASVSVRSQNRQSSQFGGFARSLNSFSEQAQNASQYQYFRDSVYTAIRPIAARCAKQAIRVGFRRTSAVVGATKTTTAMRGEPCHGGVMLKSARDFSERPLVQMAPMRIKQIAEDIEVVTSHSFLDAMDDPNELLSRSQLLWCTIASLQITGKALWWLTTEATEDRGEILRIWPVPSHWCRLVSTQESLVAGWLVEPPSGGRFPVSGSNMCFFNIPDPSDPLGSSLGPLRACSRSVTSEDVMQTSQMSQFKNGPKPSLILKAGRLRDNEGRDLGVRPVLTSDQRIQLIEAIKLAHSGAMRHGEPAIVDGLIEDIIPWSNSPAEMDYANSMLAARNRIMHTFGTNPVITGEVEGANRASAYVAEKIFCDNVVNPLLTMLSEVETKTIGPRYSLPGYRFYIWHDEVKPNDEDLMLATMSWLGSLDWISGDEAREFADLKPAGGLMKKPRAAEPILESPTIGTQGAGRKEPAGQQQKGLLRGRKK